MVVKVLAMERLRYMEQLYQEFGKVWRFKGKNIYFGGFMDEISLIGDG